VKKPALNEEKVLVKVHAASINAGDWHMLTADPFPMRLMGVRLFKPKSTILGADIAGCNGFWLVGRDPRRN
jgi:NADPH:quinone reductase-like Zn-dependent oxidoreductase